MENIEKVIIAVITFALTSLIAYLFKMRQLYVTVPKLFKYSPVSAGGSLCELIVLNRGNHVEESIRVVLDPSLKCELVASSEAHVELKDSVVAFDRLHKGKELSVILLVENGILDHTKVVSVSSKNKAGKIFKAPIDVPPNAAITTLAIVAVLSFFPILYYGHKAYTALDQVWTERKFSSLYAAGWAGLEKNYSGSDLRASYTDREFPIRLIGLAMDAKSQEVVATYEVANKTAGVLEVTGRPKGVEVSPSYRYYTSIEVPSLSKEKLVVRSPAHAKGDRYSEYEFTLKSGGEFVFNIFHIPSSEANSQSD